MKVCRRSPSHMALLVIGFVTILMGPSCAAKKRADEFLTLRIPMGTDPYTLDPQSADTGAAVFLLRQMLSTLFSYDAQGQLILGDAESYGWTDQGRSLQITVVKNRHWSDGVPVTACQYRDAILRALDPNFVAPLADLFFDIKNASERKTGKVQADDVGVFCHEQSLKIKVIRPFAGKILHALTYVIGAPFRQDRYKTFKENWLIGGVAGKASQQPAISSGAFVLVSYERDRSYTLRARRLFEKDLPPRLRAKIDVVEMPVVREPLTALSLYESGAIDLLPELPVALMPKLAKREDFKTFPSAVTYMIGFSLKANPLLQNPLVRQALARAAHQAEIPALLSGGESPAFSWIPPILLPSAHSHEFSDPFNADLAVKLFKEANIKDPKKFPTLKLYYNGGERHQVLMERIAHNWKEILGVQVQLEPVEWKVLVAQLKSKAPDMYRYAWSAAYLDPLFFLELFTSASPNNFGGWKNKEYDSIVNNLLSVPITERNAEFWKRVRRAQEILVIEDPAIVPIYHYTRNVLVKDAIKGLSINAQGNIDLSLLSRE